MSEKLKNKLSKCKLLTRGKSLTTGRRHVKGIGKHLRSGFLKLINKACRKSAKLAAKSIKQPLSAQNRNSSTAAGPSTSSASKWLALLRSAARCGLGVGTEFKCQTDRDARRLVIYNLRLAAEQAFIKRRDQLAQGDDDLLPRYIEEQLADRQTKPPQTVESRYAEYGYGPVRYR